MALVIKKPISLKDKLLQKATTETMAPQESTARTEWTQEQGKDLELTLTVQVPVLAEAIKTEASSSVVIDSSSAGQDFVSDLAAQQAYADILPRIDGLVALSGEALEKEMSILKKALIENPDACAIMLPIDIGKMVAALRTITGMAMTEATNKPKGKAKAPKQLALTAEAMEAAFDEL